MAGYPLVPFTRSSPLGCTTLTVDGAADATVPNRLSPVAIADGVAAAGVSASDAITIRYGDSNMGGVPVLITGPNPIDTSSKILAVDNNFGCAAGERTLIVNSGVCAISRVPTGGVPGDPGNPQTTIKLDDVSAASAGNSYLSCLGTDWNEITYRVNAGNLERCDLNVAITKSAPNNNCNLVASNTSFVPIVAGIVNLQIQYGVSATKESNQITQWVDASGATWSAPTVTNRNRIKALRIAVVARNDKKESSNVTSACSSLTSATPTGLCAWAGNATSPAPSIDLSPGDANWARYRYRVFETIVPLRNMIWSKEAL